MLLAAQNKHRWFRRGASVLSVLIAVGLIVIGGHGLWQRHRATHNPHPIVTSTVITHSTSTPDETEPIDACAAYRVAATHPKAIALPSVGASGCLEQVGIDQHGAIAVPDNIYTAAWYTKSALPGQSGLSIIDGHISGHYNTDGIFRHLDKLKAGDAFNVTLGSGVVLNYRVYKEQSVPIDTAVSVLLKKDPSVISQLNLITCGGRYDRTTKLYDHRIIVSAELVVAK